MRAFRNLTSAVRGLFWLVRAGGLRTQLQRLDEVGSRLHEMEQRLASLIPVATDLRETVREKQRQPTQTQWLQAGDLRAFEKKVYSQNGEDGIVAEILHRLNISVGFFVEFGVESGMECNCALLAREKNWQGLFLEPAATHFAQLAERYRDRPGVHCVQAAVTAANIESLLEAHQVPSEFEMLSIDVDGNDYWIWSAIQRWRPRVVVIEYNASHAPPKKWVMREDINYRWNGTNYHGASLASLTALGLAKGYTLVATNSTGINAFFVRQDLTVPGMFLDPSLHYHYSPPAFGPYLGGHPLGSGPFVEV